MIICSIFMGPSSDMHIYVYGNFCNMACMGWLKILILTTRVETESTRHSMYQHKHTL